MHLARRDYFVFAVLIAVMALFAWADSVPALNVPVGVATIALVVLGWKPVVRPPADAPGVPLWQKIGLSIGLALFAVSKFWPQHNFRTLAGLCIFAPQIPQMIRRYRGTDGESVPE